MLSSSRKVCQSWKPISHISNTANITFEDLFVQFFCKYTQHTLSWGFALFFRDPNICKIFSVPQKKLTTIYLHCTFETVYHLKCVYVIMSCRSSPINVSIAHRLKGWPVGPISWLNHFQCGHGHEYQMQPHKFQYIKNWYVVWLIGELERKEIFFPCLVCYN